jgi:hypothetical protein
MMQTYLIFAGCGLCGEGIFSVEALQTGFLLPHNTVSVQWNNQEVNHDES